MKPHHMVNGHALDTVNVRPIAPVTVDKIIAESREDLIAQPGRKDGELGLPSRW